MTKNHLKYLQDTLNGIPLLTQAKQRNVSCSSQSSILKTAMKNLLQEKAVRANKDNYNIIALDKKVQQLNRHRSYWQNAVNDYILSQKQIISNDKNNLPLVTRYRNGNIYQGNRIVGTYNSTKSLEDFKTDFTFKSVKQIIDFVQDERYEISAVDAVRLTVTTILTQYNFES